MDDLRSAKRGHPRGEGMDKGHRNNTECRTTRETEWSAKFGLRRSVAPPVSVNCEVLFEMAQLRPNRPLCRIEKVLSLIIPSLSFLGVDAIDAFFAEDALASGVISHLRD